MNERAFKVSIELQQDIAKVLTGLPNISQRDMRSSLIASAGLDSSLQGQINVELPPLQFVLMLIEVLQSYGTLEDGRNALEAILEAAKQYVGHEKQLYCDKLIEQVGVLANTKNSHEKHRIKPDTIMTDISKKSNRPPAEREALRSPPEGGM